MTTAGDRGSAADGKHRHAQDAERDETDADEANPHCTSLVWATRIATEWKNASNADIVQKQTEMALIIRSAFTENPKTSAVSIVHLLIIK